MCDFKVGDVVKEFKAYGVELLVHDPLADRAEAEHHYNVGLCAWNDLVDLDAIILCVSHNEYKALSVEDYKTMLNPGAVLMDVKSSVDETTFKQAGINLWRL